jgi:hypothetical protein
VQFGPLSIKSVLAPGVDLGTVYDIRRAGVDNAIVGEHVRGTYQPLQQS